MPEASGAPPAFFELLHDFEPGLDHRQYDHLGDPLSWLDGEGILATVPTRHKHLALVVGIDQPCQVPKHYAVLVTQTRAWQQEGCIAGIANVDGNLDIRDGSGKWCTCFTWLLRLYVTY